MSTRMTIIFIGSNGYNGSGQQATRLYQHSDGYPTNVLPTLLDCLRNVRKKAEAHWKNVSYMHNGIGFDFTTTPINSELLAGCYIAEETSGFGMGAEFERTIYLESPDPTQWDAVTRRGVYGDHGDIEWLYVVNALDRTVQVYGGGYSDRLPQTTVEVGTVDPLSYVEDLTEDYQVKEAATIRSATRSLGRIGFPINPKRVSGRRAAHAAQRARLIPTK